MSSSKYSSEATKRPEGESSASSSRSDYDRKEDGRPRRETDDRARERGQYRDHQSSGGQSNPAMHHGDNETAEQRRFIPATLSTLPADFVDWLCDLFQVSAGKVREWCLEEYIRIDREKRPTESESINFDPLRGVVSQKAWDRYLKYERERKNEIEAKAYLESHGIKSRRSRHAEEDYWSDHEGRYSDEYDDWDSE